MAFSWSSVTAGVTSLQATQINEVKTNTDNLAGRLGVSAYGWVYMSVSVGNKVNATQVNECQDALDYIDSMNTCVANNGTYDSGANSGQDLTIHSGADSSVHTGKDVTVHTGADVSIHTGKDVTVHTGADVSIHTGKDASIHTGKDATYNNGQNSTVHSGKDASYNNGVMSSYLNDHNGYALVPHYGAAYNPQYASNCGANWGAAQNPANVYT